MEHGNKTEEIEHLSEQEIEELYVRYLDGEKCAVLLDEYKIKLSPQKLIRSLPPKELQAEKCLYCNAAMFTNRQVKNSYYGAVAYCLHCDHERPLHENLDFIGHCRCNNCVTARVHEKKEAAENMRNMIHEKYSLDRIKPVPYSELTFYHKLLLLALLRKQGDTDKNNTVPFYCSRKSRLFTPSATLDSESLNYLLKENFLVVDPDSDLHAFKENDIACFDENKVNLMPNISLNGDCRSLLSDLVSVLKTELGSEINPSLKTVILEIVRMLSVEEIIQFIETKAAKLEIIWIADFATRDVLREQLDDFSVSELWSLSNTALKNAQDSYTEGRFKNKIHAGNAIPKSIIRLAKSAIEKKWDIRTYPRRSDTPKSFLSEIFFDIVLKVDDEYWTTIPQKYFDEVLRPKNFSVEKNKAANKIECMQCRSMKIGLEMRNNEIKVSCPSCNHINYYILKSDS